MTGRFVDQGIRILAAMALLLAVIFSPIRPTGLAYRADTPNRLPRNLSILKVGYGGQFAVSARPSFRERDSLRSDLDGVLDADIDDELTETSPPAAVSVEVLPSPCPEPHSERVSFAVARAARPLRC